MLSTILPFCQKHKEQTKDVNGQKIKIRWNPQGIKTIKHVLLKDTEETKERVQRSGKLSFLDGFFIRSWIINLIFYGGFYQVLYYITFFASD